MPNKNNDEKLNKYDEIAKNILILSRNTLLVNFRFLDVALSRLKPVVYGDSLMCDGKYIYYNSRLVINLYLSSREGPTRAYFHMMMHCIFSHMFVSPLLNRDYWDLACDIAVENAINEFELKIALSNKAEAQRPIIEKIKKDTVQITAEKVYRYLMDNYLEKPEVVKRYKEIFAIDDHSIWYASDSEKALIQSSVSDDTEKEKGEGLDSNKDENDYAIRKEDISLNSLEDWKRISEHIQQDIKTFSKSQGFEAGSFSQNLAELTREKYNYESFLKKFAVYGEAMKINDDEFDYIFYTYGFKMYKNMPLIEPLEYKEVKRIKEFVIAIDTSGSVVGDEVQSFIQKTYNILKSTESFFSKINLHIIQCDAEIQEHVKITSQEEFDEYLKRMVIKGLGGTDFRPVFKTVNELIRKKEFTNLKGLIYFTDGYGTFPEKKPDYETAFVFVNDNVEFIPYIPPWAIKLVLQRHEL